MHEKFSVPLLKTGTLTCYEHFIMVTDGMASPGGGTTNLGGGTVIIGGGTTTLCGGTLTTGGGMPDRGGGTPFRCVPAEFNHWVSVPLPR